MIEVSLELNLESFLVNSTGDSAGLSVQSSTKALRFTCERILSANQLADEKPTTDFDFLSASGKSGTKVETDHESDQQLVQYFSRHTTVDISKVMIAYGDSGYRTSAKAISGSAIGRVFIKESPNQSSLDIEMVLKPAEFDAIWAITTQQKIRRMIATLVCFQLKLEGQVAQSETLHVAGILSSSLQLMP